MKLKLIMALSASVIISGANLFVISAKQGSVNCKELLVKAFSFNHFAYAEDPGYDDGTSVTGSNYTDGYADCSVLSIESYNIDVALKSNAGQKLKKICRCRCQERALYGNLKGRHPDWTSHRALSVNDGSLS